ncbi:GGDEF domain-containing protein [Paraburkholderia sp.]|jgi:diguanylate cyclase (GGDEF)-like protein|uniref:GGDEF domain-containing protein n=1 Tax=Paraburkholderia sp. TaxID=1926495 RepID=UPI002F3EAE75
MSIPTALIGVAILSCLMGVAVLGSLFHAPVPGIRHWCVASALLAVTAVLLLFRRLDVVVASASTLLVIGSFLALQGFRRFFHRRSSISWEYGALGAILVAIVYWTYVSPDVDARGALISGFLAYIRFAIVWVVQRHRPAGRPQYAYHFVSIAAVLGAIVHAIRCVVYGFGLAHETAFLEPTSINVAFLGMATMTLPALSVGTVMLAHDRLAQRMERLATIDDLTGVLGRRAFIAQTEALLDDARLAKSKLSIAILDIDNFKRINDRHGHAAGDKALAHVASTISLGIRQTDIVGRIGGEEFALLLPLTGKEEAARLTNRLRAIVAESVSQAPSGDVTCTLSAGVDEFRAGDTVASVMARADTALYAAKASGRNCVVLAGSLQSRWTEPADANAAR